jgi:PAT family beta-lactamase induction signal transducer AmpG
VRYFAAVTLRRKLALVAGLYLVEGFPMGVFSDVWPQLLKDSGVSRAVIGQLISWLGIAWSVKAIWAPAVDRLGEWRHWIAGCLVVMALALAAVPQVAREGIAGAVWLAAALFCLASATQDVAIDATAVALTASGEEGSLSTVRVSAYRIGKLAFGSGGLLLAHYYGWAAVQTIFVPAVALFALAALWLPRLQPPPSAVPRSWRDALASWPRPGFAGAIAFLVVYRLGDLAMGPMIGLFQRDAGMSLAQIGVYSTALSAAAGLLGGG